MRTKRVYVVLWGGCIKNVTVPDVTDGTHTVVNLDDAEIDAAKEWASYDADDRLYVEYVMPDIYATFFEGMG